MKNFNDFLKTVDFEEIQEVVNQAEMPFYSSKSTVNPITQITTAIGNTSILIAIEILKNYHVWLHSKSN